MSSSSHLFEHDEPAMPVSLPEQGLLLNPALYGALKRVIAARAVVDDAVRALQGDQTAISGDQSIDLLDKAQADRATLAQIRSQLAEHGFTAAHENEGIREFATVFAEIDEDVTRSTLNAHELHQRAMIEMLRREHGISSGAVPEQVELLLEQVAHSQALRAETKHISGLILIERDMHRSLSTKAGAPASAEVRQAQQADVDPAAETHQMPWITPADDPAQTPKPTLRSLRRSSSSKDRADAPSTELRFDGW